MSRPVRACRPSRPPWTKAIARTPSHLISYAQRPSSGGSGPVRASIGSIRSGIGSRSGSSGGSIRWIIQSSPARPEQDVPAAHALAVERDHHLVLAELVRLVGPAVPDRHRPGAVLAGRDLAVELEVLERMVLRAHRQVVALGARRDARAARPRRPARRRARAAGPSAGGGRGAPGRRSGAAWSAARRGYHRTVRLRRGCRVALLAVAVEPVGHRFSSYPTRGTVREWLAPIRGRVSCRPTWTPIRSCSTTPPETSSSSSSKASTTSTPLPPCASAWTRRSAAAAASSST